MTRQEFIDTCRYYKGEKENPFDDTDIRYWYWEIENTYVITIENDPNCVFSAIDDGNAIPNLKGYFESKNGVLAAIFYYAFMYYDHYNGDYKDQQKVVADFISFFKDY